MKDLFIINPAAGKRDRTEEYRQMIQNTWRKRGLAYEIAVSQGPGDCRDLARRAGQSGEEYRIFAMGGDGTLNEVAAGAAGFSNVAVTHFAGGSGNDFVRIFGDSMTFDSLEPYLDCQESVLDMIQCNGQLAVNTCSVGLDARIGTQIGEYKRLPLVTGSGAYILSILVNLCRGISEPYTVEVNGQVFQGKQTMITACNGQFYGGGFHPVPEADPTDGMLDVVIVKDVPLWRVPMVIGKYKAGQYAQLPDLITHVVTDRLTVRCSKINSVSLDGELLRTDALDIRIAQKKLRYFYPKTASMQIAPRQALAESGT